MTCVGVCVFAADVMRGRLAARYRLVLCSIGIEGRVDPAPGERECTEDATSPTTMCDAGASSSLSPFVDVGLHGQWHGAKCVRHAILPGIPADVAFGSACLVGLNGKVMPVKLCPLHVEFPEPFLPLGVVAGPERGDDGD